MMGKKIDRDKLFLEEIKGKIFDPSGTPPHAILISNPPTGKLKITNIYYDQVAGRIVVKYDDVPV